MPKSEKSSLRLVETNHSTTIAPEHRDCLDAIERRCGYPPGWCTTQTISGRAETG